MAQKIIDDSTLENYGIHDLRNILRALGGVPSLKNKADLIEDIRRIRREGVDPNQVNKPRRGRRTNPLVHDLSINPEGDMTRAAIDLAEIMEKDRELVGDEIPFVEKMNSYVVKFRDPDLPELNANAVIGVLEIQADGYGFLRAKNYETSPIGDIYVSNQMVRQYRLRRGDLVVGYAERTRERGAENLTAVISVNGLKPLTERSLFDNLVPCYPDTRITLECKDAEGELDKNNYMLRIMDLMFPLGKGQRGLIVAPPKTGKTTLLKRVAQSIEHNYPDINLIVVLIDERPEEVTDFRRSISGEVVSSTFDEPAEHHVKVAELVMWRAKRLAELGQDVVILLDSITRLTRAYNQTVNPSGKILSGGIDPAALYPPKKFFGSARNVEEGGSITVLATALVDTGSKMDDLIFEEFKGTGNMEIHLSRDLAERRVFPAVDFGRSGTRKDELLLSDEESNCATAVRRFLTKEEDGTERLIGMVKKTNTNEEFVKKLPQWLNLLNT